MRSKRKWEGRGEAKNVFIVQSKNKCLKKFLSFIRMSIDYQRLLIAHSCPVEWLHVGGREGRQFSLIQSNLISFDNKLPAALASNPNRTFLFAHFQTSLLLDSSNKNERFHVHES